jgi:hypothetical protein
MKEKLENLPFRERIKQERGWNRWGKSPWSKIKILLKGHENRTFKEFYKKAAPLLANQEHQPMKLIMEWCFYAPNNRATMYNDYEIVDGIIRKIKLDVYTNKIFFEEWLARPDYYKSIVELHKKELPNNVIFQNGVYYYITEESKIGNALQYANDEIKNPNYKHKWFSNKAIRFETFYNFFVLQIKPDWVNNYGITQFDADFFLHPELFDYVAFGTHIIDLSKCLQFDSLKKLKTYTTRKSVEKHKAAERAYKKTQKERVAKQHELLGQAMIDYNLRKEKEKQLRREKEQAESLKSAEIKYRHGFDDESFLTYRVPVKTKK